ncbi:MAG: aminotransferase class V-fold PLP-dependent enzyme [Caldisphaera sp.]
MFREEFEVFKKFTYLNWASIGDPPTRSIEEVNNYLENLKINPDEFSSSIFSDGVLNSVKENLSKIILCDRNNVTILGTSTTPGLQTAVESLDLKKSDEVIVFDLDFPTVYAEALKLKESGVVVKTVKNKKGDYDYDDIISNISKKTRAILVSSVMWINGLRLDIKELSKIIHENEGYLIADAIQHIGSLDFDSYGLGIDFAAFGTQKWLLSPYSLGILYISNRVMESLKPPHYGYLNLDVKMSWDEFWESYEKSPEMNFDYKKGIADSFNFGGFIPVPSLIGLNESLKLINYLGIEKIREHILNLRKILIEELNELNAEILSPLDKGKESGIITFKVYSKIKNNYEIVNKLRKFSVKVSARGAAGIGGIRVSVHFPNEEEDIKKLIYSIKDLKG